MKAERKRVEPLVRTARGQLDAVLKMIENDRYCMDIAAQLQAAEGLVHKARREVLKAHLAGCVTEAALSGDADERDRKLDEIVRLLDKQ